MFPVEKLTLPETGAGLPRLNTSPNTDASMLCLDLVQVSLADNPYDWTWVALSEAGVYTWGPHHRLEPTRTLALRCEAKLDVSLLPEELTAERSLRLAVREAQVGNRDRLIRLGLDNETELVFAVVREHRDEQGNVSYHQEARLHLDRSTSPLDRDRAGTIASRHRNVTVALR